MARRSKTDAELVLEVIEAGYDARPVLLTPGVRQRLQAYFESMDVDTKLAAVRNDMFSVQKYTGDEMMACMAASLIRVVDATLERQRRQDAAPEPWIQERPTTLYRSISRFELDSLLEEGCLSGDRNLWHVGDRRNLVLFLDRDGPLLRTQGDDIERYAKRRLDGHPDYTRLQHLKGASAAAGDATSAKAVEAELRVVAGKIRDLIDDDIKNEETARRDLPWDSAVLKTVPLSGAIVWHRDHRDNLMSGNEEYGFRPGEIKSEHIQQITLTKNKKDVMSGTVDEILEVIRDHQPLESGPRTGMR